MAFPRPRFSTRTEHTSVVLVAAVIGVLGALGNVVFRQAIIVAGDLFALLAGLLRALGPAGGWLTPPLVLAAGAGALLILERTFPGHALGYGFPRFLEMVNLEGGRVKKRWMVVKTLGAAIALGAGASVGREGPIAQIGGSIGSAVAHLLRATADRTRLLVGCGAAAGIATTFNAPIAAVMFTQEIVLQGEVGLNHFSLLVIATAAAVITSHALVGTETVFSVRTFELVSYWELLTYAVLGLVLGLLAVGYTRVLHAAIERAPRLVPRTAARLVGGLMLVGVVGVFLPQNLSDGYPAINAALAGELAGPLMAALATAKLATSTLSLASGAPGGVFGPIFFIGAMTGGAFRTVSEQLLPGLTGPRGSYALVGLATFLAACTRAPLTAIFLLFETTGSYEIALPALVASVLAVMVASSIEPESIDSLGLARAGKHLRPSREQMMDLLPVSSAFHREFQPIVAEAGADHILAIISESTATSFPVLDADERLIGTISLHDLRPLLADRAGADVLIAADLCDRNVPTVTPDTSLGQALGRMEADNVEEIPVVDSADSRRVLGLLSRAEVIRAYNRTLLTARTLRDAAGPDQLLHWSKAYQVTMLPVPAPWQRQSLRALDCRARFGVTVLAVQPHEKPGQMQTFEVPDPERALEPDDVLVIAGPAAAVARFERTARDWASAARVAPAGLTRTKPRV